MDSKGGKEERREGRSEVGNIKYSCDLLLSVLFNVTHRWGSHSLKLIQMPSVQSTDDVPAQK